MTSERRGGPRRRPGSRGSAGTGPVASRPSEAPVVRRAGPPQRRTRGWAAVSELVASVHGWPIYLVVGLLAFGESAAFIGLVLPGETAMALGGALAGTGQADLRIMLATAVGASILGDAAGYAMGRSWGPRLRSSRAGQWLGEGRWERSEQLLYDRGPIAVFCGRWVGILRAVVPLVAGMSRMPLGRFTIWNAAGASTWASAVVLVGYFAGNSFDRAEAWIGNSAGALLAVAAVAGAVVGAHRWYERKRAERTKAQPSSRRATAPRAVTAST
ncbi:DedA family protein [Actinomycetospora endophytica]|uniref:DedA family protein n=1 Tax=Actinomycetospora endophytica TaxID=2291215 RepID=A0ABS8P9I7_9PSEU|nr:DedA family protein [Actinomycetospora endophytica]MCD2194933.1 DedA family protein [Actinomycetospora endophytica]